MEDLLGHMKTSWQLFGQEVMGIVFSSPEDKSLHLTQIERRSLTSLTISQIKSFPLRTNS
jgi:hypothetical protein